MLPQLFDIDTVLLTKRTLVRRLREHDGRSFYDLLQDNYSRLTDDFPKLLQANTSVEESEIYVRKKLVAWLLQEEFVFGIWDPETTKMIGFLILLRVDWQIPKGELGYFIDKDFSGKGLMTEALEQMVNFAFTQLKLEKLSLRMRMDNFSSQRLARRCGFRREGDLRSDFKKLSGDLVDVMLFGLTKAEYEKV